MAQNDYSRSDDGRNAEDGGAYCTTTTGLIAGVVTGARTLKGAAATSFSSQQALFTTASAETSATTTTPTTTTTTTPTTPSLVDAKSSAETTKTSVEDNDNAKKKSRSSSYHDCHTLFVWDFDWTIVNCNSDEYIPAQFLGTTATTLGFRNLYTNNGSDNIPSVTKGNWHACVEQMVHRAVVQLVQEEKEEVGHVSSTTISPTERIMDAARQMPYLIPVKETLQAINDNAKNPFSTGQMILSDGNTLFLNAFLQHNVPNVQFTHGVISNHGSWKKKNEKQQDEGNMEQDGLRVVVVEDTALCVVHQSQQYGGHDCPRCSANLCKSQALRETLMACYNDYDSSSETPEKNSGHHRPARIVYIGDGANDACPVLNVLEQGDVLLARVGRKRRHANECKGPESDPEAANTKSKHHGDSDADHKDDDDDAELLEGACFGIIPALDKAKLENPNHTPACQVYEWTTGAELQHLVLKLLQELPQQQQQQQGDEE